MFISLFAIFLTTLYSVVVLKILMNVHTIYIYTRTVPSHVDLFFLHQQDYYRTVLWVTWRMSHKTQNTLALCELSGLPRSFLRSVLLIFLYFCVVFFDFFVRYVSCAQMLPVSLNYPFMTAYSVFSSWNIPPGSTGVQIYSFYWDWTVNIVVWMLYQSFDFDCTWWKVNTRNASCTLK